MQETPIRLQEYGVGIFETLSTKSALKKALKKELITVNGKIGTTATYISGGEVIELSQSTLPTKHRKLILELEVVFEDEFLAVVNKPAGMLTSGNSFKTVANALTQNLKTSNQPDATVPQPIHRLDYPTTGLLLIGKTKGSIVALNRLFESKGVDKTYYAVTIGKMEPKGKIEMPVDNKQSVSEYEVLQSVGSERFEYLNLVKLNPKTGRRHQLRNHLASIGNPILGDADYGIPGLILKGKGLYLHASSLEFVHPFTEEIIHIRNELPKKFGKLFAAI